MPRRSKVDDPRIDASLRTRRLEELETRELQARMAGLFAANTPRRMARLRGGLRDGNREELLIAAYSLASTAAVVGADELRALAIEVERCVQADRLPAVEQLAEKMDRAIASLLSAWALAGLLSPDADPGETPR